jgi:nitroreductase
MKACQSIITILKTFIHSLPLKFMEFDSVIRKRRSVKSFSKKKPSWKAILDAIEATIQNPFAGNQNNIRFLIIEDKDTIKNLSKLAEQTWISESSILVLVCSDDTHLENMYGERGRIYSRQQSGAAIQTFLLKIVDLGLSACWVGAYTDETVKQKLSIPQHIQIEAMIPIGFSSHQQKRRPRKKDLENLISWESWKNSSRPTLFKEQKDKTSLV